MGDSADPPCDLVKSHLLHQVPGILVLDNECVDCSVGYEGDTLHARRKSWRSVDMELGMVRADG